MESFIELGYEFYLGLTKNGALIKMILLTEYYFNLKFASKELLRSSVRCEKEEKEQKNKLKKAIMNNNVESAPIYAENAIRKKNEALNYRRISSRIDAVATRVNTANCMKKVTSSMTGVVRSMDSALKSMNLEKVSKLMDQFEKEFEDLDVQSKCMDNAMSATTTISCPQQEVDFLMQKAAEEAGIDLNVKLPSGAAGFTLGSGTAATTASDQDELTQRLARLRQE